MAEAINAQPDDATYDDALRELAFERMVARGLAALTPEQRREVARVAAEAR